MEYEGRNPRNMIFEYVLPSSCWIENTDSHCLQIHLPGFSQEEVRIRADKYGHVIVTGERLANDNKIIHFKQSFKVPQSCDIEEKTAVLEGEIFYVTIPKIPEKEVPQVQNSTPVHEKDQIQNNVPDKNNDGYGQNIKGATYDEEEEEEACHSMSANKRSESSLMEKIKKKGRVVLMVGIAFSLVVLVSHCYQPTAQVE